MATKGIESYSTKPLTEYKHNFARSYDEMKGIDPKFYRHHIQLQDDAKPIKQQQYRMNPNYVLWMNKGY